MTTTTELDVLTYINMTTGEQSTWRRDAEVDFFAEVRQSQIARALKEMIPHRTAPRALAYQYLLRAHSWGEAGAGCFYVGTLSPYDAEMLYCGVVGIGPDANALWYRVHGVKASIVTDPYLPPSGPWIAHIEFPTSRPYDGLRPAADVRALAWGWVDHHRAQHHRS